MKLVALGGEQAFIEFGGSDVVVGLVGVNGGMGPLTDGQLLISAPAAYSFAWRGGTSLRRPSGMGVVALLRRRNVGY